MFDPLSIYAPANRTRMLAVATALIAGVALADWWTDPFYSLGFLYLVPLLLAGGFLGRWPIAGLAAVCAGLQEALSNLPPGDMGIRFVASWAGFAATGLFVAELVRNRRVVSAHVAELEDHVRGRRDAEEQLRNLIESSPAAILTVSADGRILMANEAARNLLAPGEPSLREHSIGDFLPSLAAVTRAWPAHSFRTTLQCTGHRASGEVFMAGVWFSTYTTLAGPRMAAVVVDLSEEVRSREDLTLDHLLRHARILMSGVAHEIRNLCSSAVVVHKNLSRVPALKENEDFIALGTLIEGLERLAGLELRPTEANAAAVDLRSLLDELRVLIGDSLQESQIDLHWDLDPRLPPVWADRYGLIQVFLNLTRNSQRAMRDAPLKQLRVTAAREGEHVFIRFEDTGGGVASPDELFRPFHPGAASIGLGLYVSRAIVRSFGGELAYEARPQGCCFAVVLRSLSVAAENAHA